VLISVAICTLDRAETLRSTLQSLAAMSVPDDIDWEIVIVNNGCRDHTDEVIASFAEKLPVRRAFEPQRGISDARNRAVDSVYGEYIVWTDDDVLVEPGWLAAYVEAFRRWPEAAVFGGRIIPHFELPAVEWFIESKDILLGPLGFRDFGGEALPLSVEKAVLPYGANFAVRTAAQRKFRFDPEFGLRPGRRRLHEESSVIRRILESGATGYWVPKSGVQHRIPHDHQTIGAVARYFAGLGETNAFIGGRRDPSPRWFGAPRWLWRRLASEGLLYLFHRPISPAPVWVAHLRDYSIARGAIRYWRTAHG
jgi:glycosyltransferase involved in cell wall biosynthesis